MVQVLVTNDDVGILKVQFSPSQATMEVLRDFLESSTIHGLGHIVTSQVCGMIMIIL